MKRLKAGRRGRVFGYSLVFLLAASSWGDDSRRGHAVTFVHATDPHLFVPESQSSDAQKKATGEREESLNQKAFSDILQKLRTLPDAKSPAFLVLTGDLGVDTCDFNAAAAATPATPAATPPATTPPATTPPGSAATPPPAAPAKTSPCDAQVKKVAAVLAASALKEIYLVAGNNDITNEDPGDVSLGHFNQFIEDTQKELNNNKSGVQLHNLTACYAGNGGSSSCYADIAETSYRLIGFPSYSYKNKDKGTANDAAQQKQFDIFQSLIDQAHTAGKKVLILAHVPEIDDPFTLAQDRYAAVTPKANNDATANNPRSPWSTWNVNAKLLDEWRQVLESGTVAGVFSGHLHDSHKEAYRPPYAWSTTKDYRLGFRKLFLAPPISVKNQDTSPIQARGLSLVTLGNNGIEALLYWYNQETGDLTPDPHEVREEEGRPWWHIHWPRFVMWMWELDQSNSLLIRMAILLIALLTAYLTVVAIWQIPPAENPLAPKTPPATGADQSAVNTSPYASNFGKTVIAGLGGLLATEVAKSLGTDTPSPGSKWFYIVWFISFFFFILMGLGLIRAATEGFRALIAIPRYPLTRPASAQKMLTTPGMELQIDRANQFYEWFTYWFLRMLHWIFSLRVPLLTGFDTFINLIQGKNQTLTRVFEKTIVDQQWNVTRVADAIRRDLTRLIEQKIGPMPNIVGSPVRVNISVLSADQTNIYYISRSAGSARQPFPKSSMAWISVFTGQIRWFESFYRDLPDFEKIVLYKNTRGDIAGEQDLIYLQSHYQARDDDYQAFAIFPVPWPHRGIGTDYVKGAIHISFRKQEGFNQIWQPDPPAGGSPPGELTYQTPDRMLEDWCSDIEVRAALINSIEVLGELLRGFNEVIYKSYIEPNQTD